MAATVKNTSEQTHILDYVRVVLKRLWLIVGLFTVVVGVVGFATWKATPMYRATARLNIRQPVRLLGRFDPAEMIQSATSSRVYLNTQYALLKSRSTVEAMVRRKGMTDWPEFQGKSEGEIVRSILGHIDVSPQRDTTLVDVTVEDPRRNLVHRIANALVETFQEQQEKKVRSNLEDTISRVESKLWEFQQKEEMAKGKVNQKLEEENTDLETFLAEYEYARSQLIALRQRIDEISKEIADKRPLYDKIVAARHQGNGNGGENEDGLATLYDHPVLLSDPAIQEYERVLSSLRRKLKDLIDEGRGPTDPDVRSTRMMIDDNAALQKLAKRHFLLRYVFEFEALVQTREHHTKDLEDARDRFREMARIKRMYDESQSAIARYEAEVARYSTLWETLQSSRKEGFKPVTIEQAAQPPIAPFKPDKQLNMILAIVFGLLGGTGLAFFLEYMDDTVKTKEELQKVTDVPLFGVIPNISARRGEVTRKDLYAYTQPKSTISEAFRGIRTALSYSSEKRENRLYLVTSSGPKEGKTTITINVATVMAYSGTRTLLIDADLRKPRVHKSFEADNSRGLTNVIIGDAAPEDVIQSTSIENLDILPSGPIPPNPSELLGRERMRELLEELREKYDRILLDTPPIGAVTDAAVLGRIVDSVILVVHAGKTRKKLIERGLEQLAQIDVEVSGIVLNNLRIGRRRYYPGYYHYYYYYSSYYGADDKGRSRGRSEKTS